MTEDDSLYIEEVALFFEGLGVSRIAGRILGLLLVCEPPSRTGSELVEELGASKASVSQMTRFLVDTGLIERFAVRGSRASHFRIRDDGFEALFAREMQTLTAYVGLGERGIELVGKTQRADRLRKLTAFFRFFAEVMPELIERWRAEQDDRIAAESPPDEEPAGG